MSAAAGDAPRTPERWPSAAGTEVQVVGPNPAMDRLQIIDELHPGEVHRVRTVEARAGGKSFIVARSLRRLFVDVALHGFLGGPVAELSAEECRQLGIRDLHTPIAGATRITPVIVEAKSGRSTVLNEPGPQVTPEEEARFRELLLRELRPGALVVCTGSLPPSLDPRLYADIALAGARAGAFVAVDASGAVLSEALRAGPWLVKCNQAEFLTSAGHDAHPDDHGADEHSADEHRAVVALMQEQLTRGSAVVIVTRGASGFLAATEDGVWSVSVPSVDVVNATGSGDTFLACFVATVANGGGLDEALRAAAAGGAANAAQLEPGLQRASDLTPFLDAASITRLGGGGTVPVSAAGSG